MCLMNKALKYALIGCGLYLFLGVLIGLTLYMEVLTAELGTGPVILSSGIIGMFVWGFPWVFLFEPIEGPYESASVLIGIAAQLAKYGFPNLLLIFFGVFLSQIWWKKQ